MVFCLTFDWSRMRRLSNPSAQNCTMRLRVSANEMCLVVDLLVVAPVVFLETFLNMDRRSAFDHPDGQKKTRSCEVANSGPMAS